MLYYANLSQSKGIAMFGLTIRKERPAPYREPYRVEQRRTLSTGEPLVRVRRNHGSSGFTCSAWYTDWNRSFAGERLGK